MYQKNAAKWNIIYRGILGKAPGSGAFISVFERGRSFTWHQHVLLLNIMKIIRNSNKRQQLNHMVSVFFLPEKMKSARENGFWYFFWFFSRAETVFLGHFLKNFLGQFEVFSGTFSNFFSGRLFFFSGRNLRIFSGIFFFLGQDFFFSGR